MTREELEQLVGQNLGVSEWFTIDQERIDRFAEVTQDHQFIHVDPARAAATPFGTTVAHGLLTLSLIVHLCERLIPLLEGAAMVINYGFDRVRFAAPVTSGRRVRATADLVEVTERNANIMVKLKVTIHIENQEKPAVVAEWITMQIFS